MTVAESTIAGRRGFPAAGPVLAGFALGGFFDGILLHQILQWHHLLSLVDAAGDLAAQVVWDGLFHLLMYGVALVGLWLMWRSRAALTRPGAGRTAGGWAMIGFGAWHVIDAVLSHWVLGIHRIRIDSDVPLAWDLGWVGLFGLAPLIAGMDLIRRPGGGGGRRLRAAPAAIALCVAVAGPIAARAPQSDVTLAVFLPGTSMAEVFAAAEAAGGHVIDSDPTRRVWSIRLDQGARPSALYRHGAMMVSSGPIAAGCLSYSTL